MVWKRQKVFLSWASFNEKRVRAARSDNFSHKKRSGWTEVWLNPHPTPRSCCFFLHHLYMLLNIRLRLFCCLLPYCILLLKHTWRQMYVEFKRTNLFTFTGDVESRHLVFPLLPPWLTTDSLLLQWDSQWCNISPALLCSALLSHVKEVTLASRCFFFFFAVHAALAVENWILTCYFISFLQSVF